MCAPLLFARGSIRKRNTGFVTALLLLTVFTSSVAFAQAPAPGLAGDLEIDGNLFANNPGGVIGLGSDWLDGPPGPGTGLLFPGGVPKNPATTIHILDLTENDDQDVFAKGNKVFHDPNTYQWKTGSTPPKDDIQHGLVFFTQDGNGDHWMGVAGDRRAINGTSYIDFEFLQSPLDRNPDGSFTSGGTDGGRTVGDVVLTIELTNGGSQADFVAQRWQSDGNGGYTYVIIPIPASSAFVAANIDSAITTTYDAFGSMQYGINQFGEAAVNLNALLGSFNNCFGIATVFVRTKSSAASDAELKDFINPINVNLCLDETPPVLSCPPDTMITCGDSIDPILLGTAGASDNCTIVPDVSFVDSVIAGSCPQERTIIRTWSAIDDCGNVAECVQVIDVVDDGAPVATAMPPITVECAQDIPGPDGSRLLFTSECGSATVSFMGDQSDGNSCPEVITRTYRVMDDCSNYVDVYQTITVMDTTAPAITAPSDVVIECGDDMPSINIPAIVTSDNCSEVAVVHVGDVSDGLSCPETITRTFRATDACGNATTVTQKITIDDTTGPSVSAGPDDITVACSAEIPTADSTLVTASDNCGSVFVSFFGQQSDQNSCPEIITRTYRVTDDCGNYVDYVQTITVNDTIPPTMDGPSDLTVDCIDEVPSADIKLITASDNCAGVAVAHLGDQSDQKSCPEIITRTYRITDDCGNTSDYVQKITVLDVTNPTIATADDITVQCVDDIPDFDITSVTAADECGNATVSFVGDISDNKFCPETITRTYRAEDECGNFTEATQTIIVADTTRPVISSGPDDVTLGCITELPVSDVNSIFADDNCSEVTVTFEGDQSDNNTCPETITRTYRVTDACGNSIDFVQLFTIDDDELPVLSNCSGNRNLECPEVIAFIVPTASDNCDIDPDVLVVDSDTTIGPEDWTFTMSKTWQAVDECGNVSYKCAQRINGHCEAEGLCTFTQGFYGNYGGHFNGLTTIEIIRNALSEPLVVGKPGRSVKFTLSAADCIVERLPAGTTPTTLPSNLGNANMNHNSCQTNPALPLDSNGKFENVFLGQTIALTLNSRFSTWLWLFPLSETFCTQGSLPGKDGLFGTEDDSPNPNASIESYHIHQDVLDALDTLELPRVVMGLIELCNRGLAGWDTGGASISQINNAADTINNAFDGCRQIVDCPELADAGGKSTRGEVFEAIPGSSFGLEKQPTRFELNQNVPNPFNPTTRIRLAVPQATDWTIAVYNVRGQLVTRFQGNTAGASYVDVEWDGTDNRGRSVASGIYLYRVQAGSFADVKKMVLLK